MDDAFVSELYRHPIKSHGREELSSVMLEAGRTMPGDRVWAVANHMTKVDRDSRAWMPPANFSRGSKCPGLMAINARLNDAAGTVTLTHHALGEITVNPDDPKQAQAMIDWAAAIMPSETMTSVFVARVPGRGMTDSSYPSVSINSHATLRAVAGKAEQAVSQLRWRGNIWLEGLAPWQELDWVGKTIRIGECELAVREPILRCAATTANPETGERDLDTLKLLRDNWGHQNFGVYAEVIKGGAIRRGDTATLV